VIRIDGLRHCAGNRNLIAKDTLVRAAAVGQEDGDNERTHASGWMPVGGFWCQMPGLGCDAAASSARAGINGSGCGCLVSGHWALATEIVSSGTAFGYFSGDLTIFFPPSQYWSLSS
jgi:hypothetical protein